MEIKANKANYELAIGGFFEKIWARMKIIGLIEQNPYDPIEAGQLVVIMINGVFDYLFSPSSEIPPSTAVSIPAYT